jgi:hypothetical protein
MPLSPRPLVAQAPLSLGAAESSFCCQPQVEDELRQHLMKEYREMPKQARTICVMAAILLTGAVNAKADLLPRPPAAACTPVRINSIETANLDSHGGAMTLSAKGTVTTAGWQNAELRFVSILHPQEPDATAVYEFVACPSQRPSAQVMTPINSVITLPQPTTTLHKILVEAQTNQQTIDLDAPAAQH